MSATLKTHHHIIVPLPSHWQTPCRWTASLPASSPSPRCRSSRWRCRCWGKQRWRLKGFGYAPWAFGRYSLGMTSCQDASDHQDDMTFLVGTPFEPLFATVTGRGPHQRFSHLFLPLNNKKLGQYEKLKAEETPIFYDLCTSHRIDVLLFAFYGLWDSMKVLNTTHWVPKVINEILHATKF